LVLIRVNVKEENSSVVDYKIYIILGGNDENQE